MRSKELSFAGSVSLHIYATSVGDLAEDKSQKLNPDLPLWGLTYFSHNLLPSKVCIGKLEEAGAGASPGLKPNSVICRRRPIGTPQPPHQVLMQNNYSHIRNPVEILNIFTDSVTPVLGVRSNHSHTNGSGAL